MRGTRRSLFSWNGDEYMMRQIKPKVLLYRARQREKVSWPRTMNTSYFRCGLSQLRNRATWFLCKVQTTLDLRSSGKWPIWPASCLHGDVQAYIRGGLTWGVERRGEEMNGWCFWKSLEKFRTCNIHVLYILIWRVEQPSPTRLSLYVESLFLSRFALVFLVVWRRIFRSYGIIRLNFEQTVIELSGDTRIYSVAFHSFMLVCSPLPS